MVSNTDNWGFFPTCVGLLTTRWSGEGPHAPGDLRKMQILYCIFAHTVVHRIVEPANDHYCMLPVTMETPVHDTVHYLVYQAHSPPPLEGPGNKATPEHAWMDWRRCHIHYTSAINFHEVLINSTADHDNVNWNALIRVEFSKFCINFSRFFLILCQLNLASAW